jgi:hypothetical protein
MRQAIQLLRWRSDTIAKSLLFCRVATIVFSSCCLVILIIFFYEQRKKAPYWQNDGAIFSGDRTKIWFFSFCCPFSFCRFVLMAFCCTNVVAAEKYLSEYRTVAVSPCRNGTNQLSCNWVRS